MKVIANLGLCIFVNDIRSTACGFVFLGNSTSTYTVEFRLVMFRLFVKEIITAKLNKSNVNGLRTEEVQFHKAVQHKEHAADCE
ncbi:uncharacterized protein LOC132255014 [Vitis vinifera]|uniref:uncharacterized protein LOC132255014 n=1 Tax=Vitis vinifera TaxID=29760 RepID=UPI0028834FCE|nr:uncharacterized protein LOC132255014 [Vitis vinifera]